MLRLLTEEAILETTLPPVSDATLRAAQSILDRVRCGGVRSLLDLRAQFDGVSSDVPLRFDRSVLEASLASIDSEFVGVLRRTAARISAFAQAQRACLVDLETAVPGGRAGHRVVPVERVACYAPGGRYPLPSSVLMTAVTARVAGVEQVVVVTPNRDPAMLAAAFIAGADEVLVAGGAHAIAACAYGVGLAPVDLIVGPGNAWVTAGKQLVRSEVDIDMLAGPSELVILADDTARADVIAADLLAQAEHDVLARPILITTSAELCAAVCAEVERQLADLPTADVAREALQRGGVVVVDDLEQACALSDRLAPEHLEILVRDAETWGRRVRHYGALFLGAMSAEVLGDYGAGPNHVLPTGGTARRCGGLSVLTFLRLRTWLELSEVDPSLRCDVSALARYEGLVGHARAAELRSDFSVR